MGHLFQDRCNGRPRRCRLFDKRSNNRFEHDFKDGSNLKCFANWRWSFLRQSLDDRSRMRDTRSDRCRGLAEDNMNLPFSFLRQFLKASYGSKSFTCRFDFLARSVAQLGLQGDFSFLKRGDRLLPGRSRGNHIYLFQHLIA
ncbi:hypothetical protein EV2_013427 [Malus domestica]